MAQTGRIKACWGDIEGMQPLTAGSVHFDPFFVTHGNAQHTTNSSGKYRQQNGGRASILHYSRNMIAPFKSCLTPLTLFSSGTLLLRSPLRGLYLSRGPSRICSIERFRLPTAPPPPSSRSRRDPVSSDLSSPLGRGIWCDLIFCRCGWWI